MKVKLLALCLAISLTGCGLYDTNNLDQDNKINHTESSYSVPVIKIQY